ncbi:hypothetical protein BC940DRAFT_22135 [Gongronella butleri]|nr:hypothetical protein BC940DRAFT_22135 [Gongronella butleri]
MASPRSVLPLPTTVRAVQRNDNLVHLITNAYVVFSVATTFINKYIATVSEYKFPYPYTAALIQVGIAHLLIQAWQARTQRPRERRMPRTRLPTWRVLLPASIVYVLIVAYDPYFTSHVPASLYVSLRAWCLPVMYLWSLRVNTRGLGGGRWVTVGCMIQFFGAWCIDPIHSMQWHLLLIGLGYAVLLAAYGLAVQKGLVALHYDLGAFLSVFFALVVMMLIPLALFTGELFAVLKHVLFLDEIAFWLHQVVAALLGLVLHVLMLMVIKYASALAFIVAATAKTCLQPLLAAFLFGQPIQFYDLICLVISLVGAASYFIKKPRSGKPFDSVYSL